MTPENATTIVLFQIDPETIREQIDDELAERVRDVLVRRVASGRPASEVFLEFRQGMRI